MNQIKRWYLGDRYVGVSGFGSGQRDNDIWLCRVIWSPKLGLECKLRFKTEHEAKDMAKRIKEVGTIDPEKWEKQFYPPKEWDTRCYFD